MPAVSMAIIRDGQLAWQRAFGVKDTGTNEPVDVNTAFAACSDTKPVFAYGVVKLCEKGVLDLDTPLTKYTTRRITADPRIERITTRHVLNHTTGFPNWRQGKDLPIEFDPGSRNQYSGEGFSYLQSVVRRHELAARRRRDVIRLQPELHRRRRGVSPRSARRPGVPRGPRHHAVVGDPGDQRSEDRDSRPTITNDPDQGSGIRDKR